MYPWTASGKNVRSLLPVLSISYESQSTKAPKIMV